MKHPRYIDLIKPLAEYNVSPYFRSSIINVEIRNYGFIEEPVRSKNG